MTSSPGKTITIDGVTLQLVVERKAVKNINARLRDGTLYVSAPPRIAAATLDTAILDLARRLLRRAHAHQVNSDDDALALALRVAARFTQPIQVAHVQFVTTQEACWGSYSTGTKTIRLNAVLRRMPRWVLEAVVAHELAHAVHPNHSPAFWALLRTVEPKTDAANSFLEGVAWLGHHFSDLPPVEQALLLRRPGEQNGNGAL